MNNTKITKLSKEDIKAIRYECRTGYILAIMLFLIGLLIVFVYKSNFFTDLKTLNKSELILIVFVLVLFSFLVSYAINWKYFFDIRNGVKRTETCLIQKKQSKADYEAGSGTLYIGQEMKERTRYNIFVNNIPIRVNKNFFINCNEGDAVYFNYAPRSGYLINITLKNHENITS
jgi:hypothetical protein